MSSRYYFLGTPIVDIVLGVSIIIVSIFGFMASNYEGEGKRPVAVNVYCIGLGSLHVICFCEIIIVAFWLNFFYNVPDGADLNDILARIPSDGGSSKNWKHTKTYLTVLEAFGGLAGIMLTIALATNCCLLDHDDLLKQRTRCTATIFSLLAILGLVMSIVLACETDVQEYIAVYVLLFLLICFIFLLYGMGTCWFRLRNDTMWHITFWMQVPILLVAIVALVLFFVLKDKYQPVEDRGALTITAVITLIMLYLLVFWFSFICSRPYTVCNSLMNFTIYITCHSISFSVVVSRGRIGSRQGVTVQGRERCIGK